MRSSQTEYNMVAAQSTMAEVGTENSGSNRPASKQDTAEAIFKAVDDSTKESTGVSLLHILTIGSIGASIALYFAGKKHAGIFVGLWPPTFQALKAVVDKNTSR